jgi:hypothetical protein
LYNEALEVILIMLNCGKIMGDGELNISKEYINNYNPDFYKKIDALQND